MRINCDLGECLSPNPDPQIMPLIQMANIACGGHAGDATSMAQSIQLAKQHGVSIGAHPSYFDRPNFGRVSLQLSPADLFASLRQQITAFYTLCQTHEVQLDYIKPHGALYHDMMRQPEVLDTICEVISSINPNLTLIVQAGLNTPQMQQQSERTKIAFMYEAFADRAYRDNAMVPRSQAGAMLPTPEAILQQVTVFETQPPFEIGTLCFHSDHLPSVLALQQLKH